MTALFHHARACGAADGEAERDELELARVSVALALYESWYRGGVRHDEQLFALGPRPPVGSLRALCPDAAAHEMARLVEVARRGLAPLFPANEFETNPVFDAHGIPADGDLVIDGLLLDLKTVSRPQVQLGWLWQVIAYVLLDGGRRGIDSVGLYLSRHGQLHRWSMNDLLTRLAGSPRTVEQARQEFLTVVRGYDVAAIRAAEASVQSWTSRSTRE